MTTWFNLLNQPVLEQLGWTLVHSVWQCTIAAILLAGVMPLLRGSAQARYATACFALVASLLAPVLTYFIIAPGVAVERPAQISAVVLEATTAGPVQATFPFRALLPWAVLIWACGVLTLCLRHVAGWLSVQRIRRDATPIPDSHPCAICFNRLAQRVGLRRTVAILQSALIEVPGVIGWWRPIVLVPCSALTELHPQYLEALLTHELAHIRRHDYLLNLIQIVVETLLFYHPAVWWISRQIRQERENCCDDLAVRIVGSPRVYSEALAAMEELVALPLNLALAVNGGQLLKRIKRLLRPEPARTTPAWAALLMLATVIGIAACSQLKPKPAVAQTPKNDAAPAVSTEYKLTLEASPSGFGNWKSPDEKTLTLERGIPVFPSPSAPPWEIHSIGTSTPTNATTRRVVGYGHIISGTLPSTQPILTQPSP